MTTDFEKERSRFVEEKGRLLLALTRVSNLPRDYPKSDPETVILLAVEIATRAIQEINKRE